MSSISCHRSCICLNYWEKHFQPSESIPKVWMPIKPRHSDHSSVILSESSWCSPQAGQVAFTTTAYQKCVAFSHTGEPDHKLSGNAPGQQQHQLLGGQEMGCGEAPSTHRALKSSKSQAVCPGSAIRSQIPSSASPRMLPSCRGVNGERISACLHFR